MDFGIAIFLALVGIVIFLTGFFCGRAEINSIRISPEPSEHGEHPL